MSRTDVARTVEGDGARGLVGHKERERVAEHAPASLALKDQRGVDLGSVRHSDLTKAAGRGRAKQGWQQEPGRRWRSRLWSIV